MSPEPLVQILLTTKEAEELYRWMEEDDAAPNHWETPLRPVHEALKVARYEGEW